ncbi:hypothetical protein WDU94_003478 [Cyamophila willieti]
MATLDMLQPSVQLIELEHDIQHGKRNKLGIKQDLSSIFGKKYKPKIIIANQAQGGSGVSHEPRPFACMFCPAAFKNEASLVGHVRVHVSGNTVSVSNSNTAPTKQIVHSCVYCNRSFKQQTNLDIHMRTYHPYGARTIARTFKEPKVNKLIHRPPRSTTGSVEGGFPEKPFDLV